jgi:hypothetical protein
MSPKAPTFGEDPFEALRLYALEWRSWPDGAAGGFVLIFLPGISSASFGWRHIDTVFSVRTARRSGKDSMESSQVHSRLGNQGSQFAEEIQRIEDDMGRAITIRHFKLVAQDMGNFAMLSKAALTSREGAMQKVRYVSTLGSQIF